MPKLRAIVCPVTGTDGVEEKAATELGIAVANGQTVYNYVSMAESSVLLILAGLYDLPRSQRQFVEQAPRPAHLYARTLYGKTVGIVGSGQIAQAVAARLQPFNIEILMSTRRKSADLPAYVKATDLETLLRTSDVVAVLTALSPETHHLLNRERLALMKPNVLFVNTARGKIVDEAALYELTKSRPDMRLALDVFEVEPPPGSSPFRTLPHSIFTPHIVGHTIETHDELPSVALDNITRPLKGMLPTYLRNPEVGEKWRARFAKG